MKNYFENEDDDNCYPLNHFIDSSDPEQTELVLFEAKMMVGESLYYCCCHDFCGDKDDIEYDCGKECKEYEPRNGKSGRCKFSKNCYTPIKKVKVIIDEKAKGNNYKIIDLDG